MWGEGGGQSLKKLTKSVVGDKFGAGVTFWWCAAAGMLRARRSEARPTLPIISLRSAICEKNLINPTWLSCCLNLICSPTSPTQVQGVNV